MAEFNPPAHAEITIEGERYIAAPHPGAPKVAFGQTGRKATVFKLVRKRDQAPFALKVFGAAFRSPTSIATTRELARYASVPGLAVCARQVLEANGFGKKAIKTYPDLDLAVLMPWSMGRTWNDVILSEARILPEVCLLVSRMMARVLASLESQQLAHCDISSGNVLIDPQTLEISLVDVEDLFGPALPRPDKVSTGTPGYDHPEAKQNGQWKASGDRFAGAVIMSEMLCWHAPDFRKQVDESSFFSPKEIQTPCHRLDLLLETVNRHTCLEAGVRDQLVKMFRQAWTSETLDDCPKLEEWNRALARIGTITLPPGTTLTSDEIKWQGPLRGFRSLEENRGQLHTPFTGFRPLQSASPRGSGTLGVPRIIAPGPLFQGNSPQIVWTQVPGADVYELEESTVSGTTPAQIVYSGPEANCTINGRASGMYSYRVRAIRGSESSTWSNSVDIHIRA